MEWAWISPVLLFGLLSASSGLVAESTASLTPQTQGVTEEDFGTQFVGADREGQVFLLQGESLEVFQLKSDLSLDPHVQLMRPSEMARPGFVRWAVTSDGDEWILLRSDLWCTSERDTETLPAVGWALDALTLFKGAAIAAVRPFGVGRTPQRRRIVAGEPAPQLMIQSGNKWDVFAEAGVFPTPDEYRNEFMRIVQERSVELAPGGNRGVWVADRYRYRIRLLSPAGKELTVIAGDPGIQFEDADEDEAAGELREQAGPVAVGKSVLANTAISTLRGLVEGPAGELYVISKVETLALDRYDPVEGQVERVPLDIDYQGRFSLAAGADGLYLAAFKGHLGRWFLSWEALEAAPWQVVKDLEIR